MWCVFFFGFFFGSSFCFYNLEGPLVYFDIVAEMDNCGLSAVREYFKIVNKRLTCLNYI